MCGTVPWEYAIGASETALNLFLLDRLKEFHNTYPGIRLKIYNHSTPQAVEAVRRGTVDFASKQHLRRLCNIRSSVLERRR